MEVGDDDESLQGRGTGAGTGRGQGQGTEGVRSTSVRSTSVRSSSVRSTSVSIGGNAFSKVEEEEDEEEEDGEGDESTWEEDNTTQSLPVKERSCTDRPFLLLIVISWILMGIIGLSALGILDTYSVTGLREGDPRILTRGVDYEGNVCGSDDSVQTIGNKKSYRPNYFGTNLDSDGNYAPPLLSICAENCPLKGDNIVDPYGNYGNWTAPTNTKSFLDTCIYQTTYPTDPMSVYSDIVESASVVGVAGFVLAIVASMLFLYVVRIPLILRTVVWTCILLISFLSAVAAYVIFRRASYVKAESDDADNSEVKVLEIVGSFLAAFSLLWMGKELLNRYLFTSNPPYVDIHIKIHIFK